LGLALPTLIIWVVVLPVLTFGMLCRYRHRLNDEKIKGKYAFLYRGYKDNKYYWEFIILMRKVILIVVLVFLSMVSRTLQAILTSVILSLAFYLQIKNNPHKFEVLGELEENSLICLCFLSYAGIYFLTVTPQFVALNYIVLILSLFGNLLFLLTWIQQYLKIQYKRHKNDAWMKKIQIFMSKWRHKLPGKKYEKDVQFAPPLSSESELLKKQDSNMLKESSDPENYQDVEKAIPITQSMNMMDSKLDPNIASTLASNAGSLQAALATSDVHLNPEEYMLFMQHKSSQNQKPLLERPNEPKNSPGAV